MGGRSLVAAVWLVGVVSLLLGQPVGATLIGTVKDISGGVLPGVEVTVHSPETGEERTVVSNAEGLYRITDLPRSHYQVSALLLGFKTAQARILLTSGETRTLDLQMAIGELSESVTVTGADTLVNTEEGRLSNLVDEKRVVELPLNGRSLLQLMELNPGATANPGNTILGGPSGGNTAFINGQRNRANNFLLDGTDNNDQFTAGRLASRTNLDAVQEFRVSANNFSAEFGRNSAGQINVVIKSGTNDFRGSLYEFQRNDALDARTTFAREVDPLKLHQFGASLGGPIAKDRTFLFASYEGLRSTRGQTFVRTVETPEFRALVARQFPNSIANLLFAEFPAPTPTSDFQDTGHPVSGLQNDTIGNTPSLGENPDYEPGEAEGTFTNAAQATPDGIFDQGSASVPVSESDDRDQFLIRIDHRLSDTHQVFGRYLFDDQNASDRSSIVRGGFDQPVKQRGQHFTLGSTLVATPTQVNQFRFGYSRRLRDLGTENEGVPFISFDSGVNVSFGNLPTNPATFVQNTFHWVDTYSITKGDHGIRFGGEVRRIQDNSDFAVSRPEYDFANIHDFAQDEPRAVSIVGVDPAANTIAGNVRGFRFWEVGLFFQDDWKVRPGLSLNLGLRWEWFGRPSEVHDQLTNILLGPGNDVFERIANSSVGRVDQIVPNDFNNFAPRFGFAWDPRSSHRFIVRGGIGVAYDRLFDNSITNIRFNPPFYAFATADPLQDARQAGIPIVYGPFNADGSPSNEAPRLNGPNTNLGAGTYPNVGNIIGWNPLFGTGTQSLRVPDPATRDSYTINWFFGTQYQLGRDWVVEANYVANVGRKFGRLVDYNTRRGDLQDQNLDRLNPTFGSINFRALGTSSSYHAGQLQVRKRLSDGFSVQAAYTYGKAIDSGSDVQAAGLPVDARALFLERGRSQYDVRHRLAASSLWELPFFRNRGGAAEAIFGGWQANSIVSIQSGFPFTVFTTSIFAAGGDFNGDGIRNDRPDESATFGNALSGASRQDFLSGLFPASAFPAPGGELGSLGRNTFQGPGFANLDLSLLKNIGVPWFTSEGAKLQFRAEMFNLFNRTNLGLPQGNLASAAFGRSTHAFAAREIQFALKLIF